ncbi:MAG TPA: HIT family protein [Lysobacter sp.]
MSRGGADWQLHARLAADTHAVVRWALCEVLLMDDARFPWLVLVPRVPGAEELLDLDSMQQTRLLQETLRAAGVLRTFAKPDKLNIGSLGNIVRQLHVHVVARHEHDAAWPGPVWGHGAAQRYDAAALAGRLAAFRSACAD